MTLRSPMDRLVQTLLYEAGGLAIVTPAYAALTGAHMTDSFALMLAMSLAVLVWSPIHNTTFDLLEWRLAARVASDRPPVWRAIHACSHELSTMVVTLPVILWLTDLRLGQALLLDLGLSAVYTVWALLFHAAYDRVHPVQPRKCLDSFSPCP